jgi:hypothetical protein
MAAKGYGIWTVMTRIVDLVTLSTPLLKTMLDARTMTVVRPENGSKALTVVGGFEALLLLSNLKTRGEMPTSVMVSWLDNDPSSIKSAVNAEITLLLAGIASPRSGAALIALTREIDRDTSLAIWNRSRSSVTRIATEAGMHRRWFKTPTRAPETTKGSLYDQIVAYGRAEGGRCHEPVAPQSREFGTDLFGRRDGDF